MTPYPPFADDDYVTSFLTWGLGSYEEPEVTYWLDILRKAHPLGNELKVRAARELGDTIFGSAKYAERTDRDCSISNEYARNYVTDLFKTYLLRDPEPAGLTFWAGECQANGREAVRKGMYESTEFLEKMAVMYPNGGISSNLGSISQARVDPFNQTGNQLRARDAEWSLPLISLPGRAGLDLGLSLSYSSLVYTRSGPYLYFDEDYSSISPGFRLGFASIQGPYFDAVVGKKVFMLISSTGRRIELRQKDATEVYEAGDSSYLQLTNHTSWMLLQTTDGTKLYYSDYANGWQATHVKDRNGNYLTINYDWRGDIQIIIDTMYRIIDFTSDSHGNLLSITQSGLSQPWATFGWGAAHSMDVSSFTGTSVVGTYNGESIPLLRQVGLPDGSSYTFEYTPAGQVNLIRRTAANVERSYEAFDYDNSASDCPRIYRTRVRGEYWTGINDMPEEVITQFTDNGNNSHEMVAPDGTIYKEFYGTGWQHGLVTSTQVLSNSVQQKLTVTSWTQDNTGVSHQTNPRVIETNVYDSANNRRRTTIDYSVPVFAQFGLPYFVSEYAANGATEMRRTYMDYNLSQSYLDNRIIGLVGSRHLYDPSSGQYLAKTTYAYDLTAVNSQATEAPAHDWNYHSGFTTRGNLTAISRWNVNDLYNDLLALTTTMNYDAAGSLIETTDASGHSTSIGYADSFSPDGVNDTSLGFTTLAYPTTMTDAGGFITTFKYHYDFGAKTRVQGPPPAGHDEGAIQTFLYDDARRLERVTTPYNGAYTRYNYGPYYVESYSSVNHVADERYSFQCFDGFGRTFATSTFLPDNSRYATQFTLYDSMGRVAKRSNPTEMNGSWIPSGDDSDWIYTQQTYDWQGRPLVTTTPDNNTKEANYEGCGCAGGEVMTLASELVLLPPQSGSGAWSMDRRRQKTYQDVLGRVVKTEVLNRDGTPYTSTVSEYNARNQVKAVKEYKGAATSNGSCPSGTCQVTTRGYDGYGRLETEHVPQQNGGTATTYAYNPDDTILSVTDARGASQTFGYNNRHLVTGITYAWPGGGTVPTPASYDYDAAGNRTSLSDGSGSVTYHYDQLSRMDWEERTLAGLPGVYRLSYGYNLAGQVTSLVEPSQFGASVTYTYDTAARLKDVTGSGFAGGVSEFASNMKYRAWGALKEMDYGNGLRLNNSFDSRLQPVGYQVKVPNTPVGQGERARSDYEYEGDGRMKKAYDHTDSGFDRSNLYDHVGRLVDARTTNSAYFQSFSYDEFSNMTVRANGSWRYNETVLMQYANNRNTSTTIYPPGAQPQTTNWVYNADGDVTNDHNKQYSYDAEGNKRLVFENTASRFLWLYQDYDADGERVKRVEQIQFGGGPPATVTSYYLRSSALDDSVIIELDQNGQKRQSYVYANGMTLAQQRDNQVQWVHVDPVTGSLRETGTDGNLGLRLEFDPLGNDAPLFDPAPPEDPTPDYLYGGTYGSNGNPYDGASGCTVDGQPMDCSFAVRLVSMGAADVCPDNRCGPRHNGRGWEMWNGSTGWSRFGPQSRQRPTRPPKLKPQPKTRPTKSDVDRGSQANAGVGMDEIGLDQGIMDLVNTTLANSACVEFFTQVLQGVSSRQNPVLEGGDLRQIFKRFVEQPRKHPLLTRSRPPGSGGVSSPIGNINQSSAAIFVVEVNDPKNVISRENRNSWDALGIVAEMFHLAGSKEFYTDQELADFVNNSKYDALIRNYILPEYNPYNYPKTQRTEAGYSMYFHAIQSNICNATPRSTHTWLK